MPPSSRPAFFACRLHTCAEWYRCKHRAGDVPPTDRINRSRKQNKRAQSEGKTPPPNLPAGVLTTLWLGRNDPESPLARLSGHDDVLRTIIQLLRDWYRNAVSRDGVFVSRIAGVAFPQPSGLYCNMMPIRLPESIRSTVFHGDFLSTTWQSSVPKEFHGYLPLIASCPLTKEDEGAIGYLTVDERTVEMDGASQRRGGLHAESPGLVALPPTCGGGEFGGPPHPGALTFFWGGGHYTSDGKRGVYCGGVCAGAPPVQHRPPSPPPSPRRDAPLPCSLVAQVHGLHRDQQLPRLERTGARARGDGRARRPRAPPPAARHGHAAAGERARVDDGHDAARVAPACGGYEAVLLSPGHLQGIRLVRALLELAAAAPATNAKARPSPRSARRYAAHSTPNPLGITPPPEVPILHASKFAKAGHPKAEAQGTPLADAPAPSTDRPERQRSGSDGDESDEEAGATSDDADLLLAVMESTDAANRRVAAQLEVELQGAAEELARTSLGVGGGSTGGGE